MIRKENVRIYTMLLESLNVHNLRNLQGKLVCRPGFNILIGENGQGKTNWLEAIHILATTRSFKTTKLSEAIRFEADTATIEGDVHQAEGIRRKLRAVLDGNTKSFLVNGKRETVRQYLGQLHAVVFNADQLEIIRGTPEPRRKFLDSVIVSIHPPYVQILSDYARVIKQKNALLQSAREGEYSLEKTAELLGPWNERLVALAARIHRSRVRIVERLNEALEKRLFGREDISVRYASALEEKGDLSHFEELMSERLKLRVRAELTSGHSLIGPHRDELEILFDGHDLRRFGSAGQQRSALLLLQLANIAVFHAQNGEYPLFLLDDIDSELDYQRIGNLLEYLSGKTQMFATTSKQSFVDEFGSGAAVSAVRGGAATAR